jgi:heptosyltransferase-2
MYLPKKLKAYLRNIISIVTTIPYESVAYNQHRLFDETKFILLRKYFHKYFLLKVFNQLALQKNPTKKDRILWIFSGKNHLAYRSIGDSIMDLSGRALLINQGWKIDLYTFNNLAELFTHDDVFENIYTDIKDVDVTKYDHILFTLYTPRSIRLKLRFFRPLRFSSLWKYLQINGQYNQITYSYAAINELFDIGLSDSEIDNIAKPYLVVSNSIDSLVQKFKPCQPYGVIAVGGMDQDRTYEHWLDVFKLLDQDKSKIKTWVLVGSANGLSYVETVIAHSFKTLNIISFVNQLPILQVASLIKQSSLFIGSDGGLMHVAHSTNTPTVTLFTTNVDPRYRVTKACYSVTIQSRRGVSLIPAKDIVDAAKKHMISFVDVVNEA